jgi:hypothetical protein
VSLAIVKVIVSDDGCIDSGSEWGHKDNTRMNSELQYHHY